MLVSLFYLCLQYNLCLYVFKIMIVHCFNLKIILLKNGEISTSLPEVPVVAFSPIFNAIYLILDPKWQLSLPCIYLLWKDNNVCNN